MAIEFGPGIVLGAGVQVGGEVAPPTPLSAANIYYPIQTIIGAGADGASVPALTNYGVDGVTYAATYVPGRTQPTVATLGGYKVLRLDGYGNNQWGYNIANAFTVTSGSLFMVGWDSSGSFPLTRCMGFGGQYGSPYQLCFFGYSDPNGTSFLFRNTGDGGMTQTGLSSVGGLKAFGLVKNGNNVVYYDNNTIPVSYPLSVSGVYGFNTVGYRSYGIDQPSTGYLGDVAWFNTALSNTDAASIMTYLKSLYGIA